MPAAAHYLRAETADPFPGQHCWPSFVGVLDLPRLLVHEMRAAQAQVHLRVVAQVDHPVGRIDGVAAPAWMLPSPGRSVGSAAVSVLMLASVRDDFLTSEEIQGGTHCHA
ncbi:MAG: hypothetical protein M3Y49_10670 [Actinomycetota bacterium]|nr:hypothetical protein [Actinomycetota bacterium]